MASVQGQTYTDDFGEWTEEALREVDFGPIFTQQDAEQAQQFPVQGGSVFGEPALPPVPQYVQTARAAPNPYFMQAVEQQSLETIGYSLPAVQSPYAFKAAPPAASFNNGFVNPQDTMINHVGAWQSNGPQEHAINAPPQFLDLPEQDPFVGLEQQVDNEGYTPAQAGIDAVAPFAGGQQESTLSQEEMEAIMNFQPEQAQEDAFAMNIAEQQQQMGSPVDAQQEQDPLQIQQETRPRTRGTRPPAQEKAGWEYFVTNGKLDCKELRAARYTKTKADYGNDKRAGAKLQNTSHKADVKNEMQNEVVALVQSICEISNWDAEASPLGFVLIPYKHRVHDKAHITGQGAPSKNTLAAWKTKEEKRKHRFQVWQLASFWAHRSGKAPPVNGEHMKKELVKDEDWQRSLEASTIPIPEWLADGPR